MDDQLPHEGLIRIDLIGKDPGRWEKLRSQLIERIMEVLDTIVDEKKGATLRDEGKALAASIVSNVKARIAKPGLENDKTEAEIGRLYAEAEAHRANARLTNAKADELEFTAATKKLRFALSITKAILIHDQSSEAIVFSQQVESILACIDEFVPESPTTGPAAADRLV